MLGSLRFLCHNETPSKKLIPNASFQRQILHQSSGMSSNALHSALDFEEPGDASFSSKLKQMREKENQREKQRIQFAEDSEVPKQSQSKMASQSILKQSPNPKIVIEQVEHTENHENENHS